MKFARAKKACCLAIAEICSSGMELEMTPLLLFASRLSQISTIYVSQRRPELSKKADALSMSLGLLAAFTLNYAFFTV